MARKKCRVIGCGNPLMGNDAVGLRVIEKLNEDYPDVDVVEGGLGGLGLVPLIEGYDRVIIVDATTGYGLPGDVNVFTTPPPSEVFPMSLHDIGVAEALNIASELGIKTEIVIVGIEGGSIFEFSDMMSPEVEVAIAPACERVLEELEL